MFTNTFRIKKKKLAQILASEATNLPNGKMAPAYSTNGKVTARDLMDRAREVLEKNAAGEVFATTLERGETFAAICVDRAQHEMLERRKGKLARALVKQSASLSPIQQIKAVIQDKFAFGAVRRQQLEEITGQKREKSKAEKRIDRNMALVAISSGFSVLGQLVFAPLVIPAYPLMVYVSIPNHVQSFKDLKQRKFTINVLVSTMVIGAILSGYILVGTFAVMVPLLAYKLRFKIIQDAKKNLIDVYRQQSSFAWVLVDGVEVQVPFESLEVGQVVVVDAGEVIPVDGILTKGMASVDQRILTGEAQPVEREAGDQVYASTVVLSGKAYINVEKAGAETTVAQIGQMLNNTINFKPNTQLRAEALANRSVIPTLILGGISVPFLGFTGGLAVLNSHIKHKMSVAAPISIMNFLNMASKNGILIKDGHSLDLLSQVDTVVFDKTGTLTEEQPHIGAIHACADLAEHEILRYAAGAEQKQTHPIARAILQEAMLRQLRLPEIDEAQYKIGYGLTMTMENKLVQVGSHRFIESAGIAIPADIQQIETDCHQQAHSLILVAVDGQVVGAIELLPTVRPEAKRVIRQLRQRRNIKHMVIISGDHETPTRALAQELGIEHYFASTLPQDKANLIKNLQEEGKFICYVGDGINDAIALTQSEVSISLRGASTVATDAAQIVLMDGKLNNLVSIFELGQRFRRNTNTSFAIVVVPALLSLGGVLFFHLGFLATIWFNAAGLAGGVANSMLPLLTDETED